jgi:hypothetical protein
MLSPATRVIAGMSALLFLALLYLQVSSTVPRPTAEFFNCLFGVLLVILGGVGRQLKHNKKKQRGAGGPPCVTPNQPGMTNDNESAASTGLDLQTGGNDEQRTGGT